MGGSQGLDLFARWSPANTTEEGKAFVQARIGLYCQMMFWSIIALVGFIAALYEVYPATRPEKAGVVYIYAAPSLAILYAAGWLARYRPTLSGRTLYGLDVTAAVMIGTGFAVSCILSADRIANVYSSFIWASFAVFGRALIIPSSGRRSAVMASLGMAPLLVIWARAACGVLNR